MKLVSAKLPHDDAGAELMRFENVRGQRYTEILLVGGHAIIADINAGIYNTIGLNDPDGTGDTTPQAVLDRVDLDALKEEYGLYGALKNGPRLWCLDWVEVMVGKERDAVAYKEITGKRDTHLGINAGSPAFLLDDPNGDSWCMKSASLMVDPSQSYESLKDLGGRLKPAPGWKFRAVVLQEDLVLTSDNGGVKVTQDELGNTYDRVGGPFSNYKP